MTVVQGIVLTGGKSRRMGKDKSTLYLGGKSFTEHIIDALLSLTRDILVVGPEMDFKNFKGRFLMDIYADKGPASGILTGLTESTHEINLILSCDVPLIKDCLLKDLLNRYKGEDVLICKQGNQVHPLLGIYHKRCSTIIKNCIEKNKLKMTDILDELKVEYYSVPDIWKDQLVNVNLPGQYEKLKNEYSN
ncbi:MAG TPA: hypothetical protein DCX54_09880 [Flavobacteriales bacterium]|nr:hypothetical protein [Flavobacteriales bacterium]